MKVYLRAFELEDLNLLNAWHNDDEVNDLTLGNKYFVSSVYDRKWLEEKILSNNTNVYCAVCLKSNNNMIGYVSLNNIDYRNRKATWGGIVIGNKEDRNKGYASEAAFQILQYAFEELGMNKITGYWLESNKASLIIGKLFGFKQEGILREDIYKHGTFHNVLVMSMLREEYNIMKENYGGTK